MNSLVFKSFHDKKTPIVCVCEYYTFLGVGKKIRNVTINTPL
jgi:hypothetical protein